MKGIIFILFMIYIALAVLINKDVNAASEPTLEQAAIAGDAEAQYRLAMQYYQDRDHANNGVRARNWLRAAAKRGHGDAAWILARWSEQTAKDPTEFRKILKWYFTAYEHGHAEAAERMAYIWAKGFVGTTDTVLSYYWSVQAASHGQARSIEREKRFREKYGDDWATDALVKGEGIINTRLASVKINPAATRCPKSPEYPWWANITPHEIITHIAEKYNNNWTVYVAEWSAYLVKMQQGHQAGKTARVKGYGVRLSGTALKNYIADLEQRLTAIKCLQAASR